MFEHPTTSKQQLQNQVVWILRSLQYNIESEGKMRCPGFMKLQCPNGIIDQVKCKNFAQYLCHFQRPEKTQ